MVAKVNAICKVQCCVTVLNKFGCTAKTISKQ